MKIFRISQNYYRNPNIEELTPNQLRSIVVKEIFILPGGLPIIDEGRIKDSLRRLRVLREKGDIRDSVGHFIVEAMDNFLFESKAPNIVRLNSKQKTEISEMALKNLSRLMREVLSEK